MNIVLRMPQGGFYIACVKRNGKHTVFGKYLDAKGRLMKRGQVFDCKDLESAETRCRNLAKMKIRKRKFVRSSIDELPPDGCIHIEMPPELQLSEEEMVHLLNVARHERYVIFKDVKGMEDFFDAGVEYFAIEDGSDFLSVTDRFGINRHCHAKRMESIELTENAIEAMKIEP